MCLCLAPCVLLVRLAHLSAIPKLNVAKAPANYCNFHCRYTVDAHELTFSSQHDHQNPLTHHVSDSPCRPLFPQLSICYALKANTMHTNNDLLSRPLASQLRACEAPLHSCRTSTTSTGTRSSDERLTKWLEPTVNDLYAFSETIGEGVSPVRLMT